MSEEGLRQKIRQLEEQLVLKQNELLQYKMQMRQVNQRLESLIGQMSADEKILNRIQKALSPTENPRIPGFEFSTKFVPGQKMGGDYFDIFELEDKLSFGILVASCSGYSVSAILLSVLLKVSSLIEARRGTDPHLVLQMLAKELLPQMKPKDEAHIFYGLVDRRTYQMRYSLAGNILAFHQRPSEKWSDLSATTGALGSSAFKPDSSHVLELQSKDRFVLCTPGLVESQNLEGQNFGREWLRKSLSSASKTGLHEIRNEVLFQLENFVGSSESQKDLTVVVAEVQDRILKLTKS